MPAILLLPRMLGLRGVVYAQPAADVLATVITVWMAWRLGKELNAKE